MACWTRLFGLGAYAAGAEIYNISGTRSVISLGLFIAAGDALSFFVRRKAVIDLRPIERHKAVRQRLHEAHDRILLCLRQAEAPDFARVDVLGRLRRGPAGRAFTGVMGRAARQHIARVVEMHDLLQARKISVMRVGLDEGRIRPLVHIAKRRHLNSRLVVRRQLEPSRIDRRGLAEEMSVAEKSADTAIDE